jgi:hypothetical protein
MQNLTAIALTLGWLGLSASGADFDSERLQNWHHWRGPNADGTAPSGDPPVTWDENTNVKWKVEIPGRGSATPIVWGNRVFVLTAVEAAQPGENGPAASPQNQNRPGDAPRQERQRQETQGQDGRRGRGGRGRGGFGGSDLPTSPVKFMVLCLDRQTGQTLWERQASELVPHEGFRPGDGSFASGSPTTNGQHLYAYFGSYGIYCYDFDGNLIWNRDLGNMQTRKSLWRRRLADLARRHTGRELGPRRRFVYRGA